MEEIDPQRFVLPALLALLFLGAFLILVTSGGSEDATGAAEPAARSTATTPTKPAAGTGAAATRRIPSPTPNAAKHFVHVESGDTPTSIAQSAGLSVQRLLELNPSIDPGNLKPGQTLKLAP
jgi:LysM repeat protein